MINAERIQELIHKLEVDSGVRRLNYLVLTLAVVALAVWYDTHCYRNFASPEAMDAAQVGRNLAEGHGFKTEFIRPFSIYLMQKHNHALHPAEGLSTNDFDFAQIKGLHPDLANAPVYPLVLAGLLKLHTPEWKVLTKPTWSEGGWFSNYRSAFWTEGGHFMRYPPEFYIAIFNQILLLVVVLLTFLITRKIWLKIAM